MQLKLSKLFIITWGVVPYEACYCQPPNQITGKLTIKFARLAMGGKLTMGFGGLTMGFGRLTMRFERLAMEFERLTMVEKLTMGFERLTMGWEADNGI